MPIRFGKKRKIFSSFCLCRVSCFEEEMVVPWRIFPLALSPTEGMASRASSKREPCIEQVQ